MKKNQAKIQKLCGQWFLCFAYLAVPTVNQQRRYSKCEQMLGYSIKLLIHYLKFGDVPIPHQNPRNHWRLPSRIFARIIP